MVQKHLLSWYRNNHYQPLKIVWVDSENVQCFCTTLHIFCCYVCLNSHTIKIDSVKVSVKVDSEASMNINSLNTC